MFLNCRNPPWFLIEFSELGFIGKLFRTTDLPIIIQFFIMFYKDKPCDWLLIDVINTLACNPELSQSECRNKKFASRWIHHRPSQFQHMGTYSSLKGKIQKLKDHHFATKPKIIPKPNIENLAAKAKALVEIKKEINPSAKVNTDIDHYQDYTLARAYNGDTFFWGKDASEGNFIEFELTPPVPLTGFE